MLAYLYHALNSFRSQFARRKTWILFCALVLGFIGCSRMDGLTDICRFFHLGESGYHALLHFFRSNAWNLDTLTTFWGNFILSQGHHLEVEGRMLLNGDHILNPKDGRKMPGVVSLRQDSETQSKPSYFRGHRWSALGMVVGCLKQPSCVPLSLRLHQGFAHLGLETDDEGHKQTLGQRMVQMALQTALHLNKPAIFVLDAFFSVGTVFRAASHVMLGEMPFLTLLVRAKKNYVAYHHPPEVQEKKRGRPRKYGEKLKLYDEFERTETFEQEEALIYGKKETLSYRTELLLWKPIDQALLFIWVKTSHGQMVLMCNDLNFNPVKAIQCYCLRMRIEVMFSWLSCLLGAFDYRFWSKFLPRHSRRPTKNSEMQGPLPEHQERVKQVWECYERFVMVAGIALGLMKLIALQFPQQVWGQFRWFLRSRSRELPSARTVKAVLACQLQDEFRNLACHAIMREIRDSYKQTHPPFSEAENVEFKEAA